MNMKKGSFIFGCVSLAILFAALLILKYLTPDQKFYFKIIIALACAGVSAAIPGITTLKYKGVYSASGAIVVFLVVLKIQDGKTKFDLTLFPKEEEKKALICDQNLSFDIQLLSGSSHGVRSDNCNIKFTDIPISYYNEEPINLNISGTKKWLFKNGERSTLVNLNTEAMDVFLKIDTNFLRVGGTLFLNDKRLKKAKIIDERNSLNWTYTNEVGYFTLKFHDKEEREIIKVIVESPDVNATIQVNMGNVDFEKNLSSNE